MYTTHMYTTITYLCNKQLTSTTTKLNYTYIHCIYILALTYLHYTYVLTPHLHTYTTIHLHTMIANLIKQSVCHWNVTVCFESLHTNLIIVIRLHEVERVIEVIQSCISEISYNSNYKAFIISNLLLQCCIRVYTRS